MSDYKKTLCLDFDGVIHGYDSGWQGAGVIDDPPVPGAMAFIWDAAQHFQVYIFSSRSADSLGLFAMQTYLENHMVEWAIQAGKDDSELYWLLNAIQWPETKPPSFLSIDDRAIQFTGVWPDMETLLSFKTWQQK